MKFFKKVKSKIYSYVKILIRNISFVSSKNHWEKNYSMGRTSGGGSYGRLAEYKSEILNNFVEKNLIRTVCELGCGDGNQLSYANYPIYIGYDVSETAIKMCQNKFKKRKNWSFIPYNSNFDALDQVELSLSLDVIYHLVEDDVFQSYMENLFKASSKYIIIYSNNTDKNPIIHSPHILHRKFTDWVEKNRRDVILTNVIKQKYNYLGDSKTGSRSDFFIYKKTV
jgi:hypothetical protein